MRCKLARWGAAVALAASILIPTATHAGDPTDFLYHFGVPFSGAPPASETQPWFSAQFSLLSEGTVQLTLKAVNLVGSENIDSIYFNLNPLLNPGDLGFQLVETSGGFSAPKIATGADQFKAGGDGRYDLRMLFNQGGTDQNRFSVGDYGTWNISGIAGLQPSDFAFLSLASGGGSPPFYAAAHVQRIGPELLSGWIRTSGPELVAVPEPGSGTLWIVAAAVWLCAYAGKGRKGWERPPCFARGNRRTALGAGEKLKAGLA